ncbi:hypothetical protein QJS10_CPB04g01214 [Acorus calamus]|uniref:Uncharacterized protein n=1 Tax=Acorus calamus TaxID=4465 RepID=A0AAV9EZU3_ACOCL|nr:hypothetical protein QJS10_CPB04g01214 [Acorus calamus]
MSPFKSTRTLLRDLDTDSKMATSELLKSNSDKFKSFNKWFSVIKAVKWQEKSLFPVMDLSKALHGFIVFEVEWKDVRGINYLNELQTDTSLTLEVKSMKKWEFDSLEQALHCTSSWFMGMATEAQSLKHNMKKVHDLHIHNRNSSSSSPSSSEAPFNIYNDEDSEELSIAPTQYVDTLLLFRFSDRSLPTKLGQLFMSDVRLLTLLESGLPSWAVFFQSYPLFKHMYRPWMRPLAQTLYVLISLLTIVIGFYDLYKNIPLLKATVAHIFGPFFNWIETWDMVSRIRYLGTMLFLQNLEKGVIWILSVSCTVRPLFVVLTKPLIEPFTEVVEFIEPVWNIFIATGELFFSTVWDVVESLFSTVFEFFADLLWPFEFLYSYIWNFVLLVYPLLNSMWELLIAPIRIALTLVNHSASILAEVYDFLKGVWQSASSVIDFISLSKAESGAYEISIWRSLWNDLFSQIFQALRSILKGLMVFFVACNRHRLSIYRQMQAFLQRITRLIRLVPRTCTCRESLQTEHKVDAKECDHCK